MSGSDALRGKLKTLRDEAKRRESAKRVMFANSDLEYDYGYACGLQDFREQMIEPWLTALLAESTPPTPKTEPQFRVVGPGLIGAYRVVRAGRTVWTTDSRDGVENICRYLNAQNSLPAESTPEREPTPLAAVRQLLVDHYDKLSSQPEHRHFRAGVWSAIEHLDASAASVVSAPSPVDAEVTDDHVNGWRLVRVGEVGSTQGGHGSWVETDHPAVVACMGSAPPCIAGGCQYERAIAVVAAPSETPTLTPADAKILDAVLCHLLHLSKSWGAMTVPVESGEMVRYRPDDLLQIRRKLERLPADPSGAPKR